MMNPAADIPQAPSPQGRRNRPRGVRGLRLGSAAMPSTRRFLRQYLRPVAGATTEAEIYYARGAERLPATLYRPANNLRRLPGWVVLHGLTRTGRAHTSLVRFARAVASAGNVVLVPEIPEWRDLRVEPALTIDTIRAAVAALQQREDVRHEHVGLFGFSFGASQALVAATEPDVAGMLAGVAAWGGYCDLRRTFRFGLTGLHEIDGVTYQTEPDPYGAWIMAGNYLTRVPGHADAGPVARAVHALAIEAGERGTYAWDPIYDESKRRLRTQLPPRQHALFDMLAPLTTDPRAGDERVLELAGQLASAALDVEPLLDPRPHLPHVRVPVLIAHGRDDRLIPFSESIRLSRELPRHVLRRMTITALFQHSGGTQSGLGPAGLAREGTRFMLLLRGVLGLV
jgi:pimeloyl-ACP methyl ester carboxylesterase